MSPAPARRACHGDAAIDPTNEPRRRAPAHGLPQCHAPATTMPAAPATRIAEATAVRSAAARSRRTPVTISAATRRERRGREIEGGGGFIGAHCAPRRRARKSDGRTIALGERRAVASPRSPGERSETRVDRALMRNHPGFAALNPGYAYAVRVRHCGRGYAGLCFASASQVATTVSGLSDMLSICWSTSHCARSGWSDGPWPQMPTYLPACGRPRWPSPASPSPRRRARRRLPRSRRRHRGRGPASIASCRWSRSRTVEMLEEAIGEDRVRR